MSESTSPSDKGRLRDEQIVRTLCLKVRICSLEQIAVMWWGQSSNAIARAGRRLHKLVERDILEEDQINAHPFLPLSAPVVAWNPGDGDPDFGAVAYQFESRWTTPFRTVTAYVASEQTASQRGGFGGGLKQREHATHDLHVAELYLRLFRDHPALAEGWAGEDARKAQGLELFEKLPDAVIFDSKGTARLAIEFGGRYPPERVAEFHEHCKERRLPYQFW